MLVVTKLPSNCITDRVYSSIWAIYQNPCSFVCYY